VVIPRGIPHRIELTPGVAQHWFIVECRGGLHLPKQWRNEVGQLRMDAPYCHRDFRPVDFRGPVDESIRTVVVKRRDRFHAFELDHSPRRRGLGRVGLPLRVPHPQLPAPRRARAFAPHVARHLRHTRRAHLQLRPADGRLPPRGDPLPLPHSSVDCDEVLFYSAATSRPAAASARAASRTTPWASPTAPTPAPTRAASDRRHQRARRDARHRQAARGDPLRDAGRRPFVPA
jgi:hypothetical protein